MKRLALLLLLPFLLTSCRSLTTPEPAGLARVQAAYRADLPVPIEARQSLVFEFSPHWWWPTIRLTTLGYANFEPRSGNYAVVCLSPMGVKLFDIARTNGQTEVQFSMPVSGDPREIGRAIGDDISALYFELTPPPDATAGQRKDHLIFRSTLTNGWSEYEFDLTSTRLLRKTTLKDGRRSTMTYADYQHYSCGYYPTSMKLINHKAGYTLTIRNLDIRPR